MGPLALTLLYAFVPSCLTRFCDSAPSTQGHRADLAAAPALAGPGKCRGFTGSLPCLVHSWMSGDAWDLLCSKGICESLAQQSYTACLARAASQNACCSLATGVVVAFWAPSCRHPLPPSAEPRGEECALGCEGHGARMPLRCSYIWELTFTAARRSMSCV